MQLAYLEFTFHPPHRTTLTILVAVLCVLPVRRWLPRGATMALRAVPKRPRAVIALVGLISFLATSLLASKRGLPLPYVHDEFSYLLAADTFARGRLTNPPPAMWEHFETMHVLVTPGYQSKYPPGQGLVLAFGQVVFGHPVRGVWVVTAIACMAITWMLLALVPPRWALIAGLITALHPQVLEWGQRYWGGSIAFAGGALFTGAMLRIISARNGHHLRNGIIAGLGLAILANTRPFEGAVVAVLIGAWWALSRTKKHFAAIVGIVIVLVPTLLWMGCYNWRVTGSPTRLPYQEHQRQYGYVPLFLFQEIGQPPTYRHAELEQFHVNDQVVAYRRRASLRQFTQGIIDNVYGFGLCVFGNVGALAIPLVALPIALWKDRRVRELMILLILFVVALMTATFIAGHYAAPAAGIVVAIMTMLIRRVYLSWSFYGPMLVRITVGLTLLWSLFFWKNFYDWRQEGFPVERQRLLEKLEAEPGRHLAIVEYGEGHDVHQEWVYNEADIEGAKVVWARAMDAEKDQSLVGHFRARRVWTVRVDHSGADVREVTGGAS